MLCYNDCYLPIPPRDWSRVQNSCSVTTNVKNDGLVKIPYSNKLVPSSLLGETLAMLNKGNVLQYKANSSNLTKKQKYSKIAQGKWTNRNTTWATQSTRGYTNPNTSSLKRSGNVTNVAIDPITGAIIGQTIDPITCPKTITYINEGLPLNNGSNNPVPTVPEPIPPKPSSNIFPPIVPDTPISPIVIQDEGILICSVQENICTGETKSTPSQQLCNPTTDSDVPGYIQLLCWNDGTPTWYSKQRYVMTNSTDKWPVNAKLSSSVRPLPPTIISATSNGNNITLTWTYNKTCLPISTYHIFQNGLFVKSVSKTIFTTVITVNGYGSYEFFIIAVTNGSQISSEPSNTVTININTSGPPQNLVVEWASAKYSDQYKKNVSMDVRLSFDNPATISYGNTPSYFVVNIFDDKGSQISTKNIDYISSDITYIVDFEAIDYSLYGNIDVYLVTTSDDGKETDGDVATCDYVSSELPIYINATINDDMTVLTFTIVTQTELNRQSISMYTFNGFEYYTGVWDTVPTESEYLTITLSNLSYNVLGYNVTMNSQIFGLDTFPNSNVFQTSNNAGISQLG